MSKIVSKPDYGEDITENNKPTDRFQEFLDDIEERINGAVFAEQVSLPSYTVQTLPEVTKVPGMIFVTNEVDGSVPAYSDGVNWRRITDRHIVS